MVVALHAAAPYLYQFTARSAPEWMFANIVDSFTRACVPVFFMISGYFFLGDAAPRRKHFVRIVAALAFYSLIALAYRWAIGQDLGFRDLVSIAVSPAFYHLWFFYAIITVYLLMKVVRVRDGGTWTMAIIIAAMLVLNPSVFEMSSLLGRAYQAPLPGFLDGNLVYYFGYACIGACFRRFGSAPRIPHLGAVLAALYVVSSVAIAAATFGKSAEASAFVNTFYAYSNNLVVLQSVALFGAIHQSRTTWPLSQIISDLSLPIYGLHALILDTRYGFGLMDRDVSAFVVLPASFFLALAVSAVIGRAVSHVDQGKLVH